MPADPAELWRFLPIGYLLSVLLEGPVLFLGLAPRHSAFRRVISALWLTACTYPIVVLVLPQLIWRPLGDTGYWPYIAVAEVFAPAAECFLFWLAFWRGHTLERADFFRDMAAIIVANLASFLLGPWLLRWLNY
jgi:hypothetical protein